MSMDQYSADQILELEKELNDTAKGVIVTKDKETGKIWFKWDRPLTDYEKAKLRGILIRRGIIHISNEKLFSNL